jgi:RNA-directed DNA polymerase
MQKYANVTKRIDDWHDIDWYQVNRNIRNLRRRIFRATCNGKWKNVRSLQRLMFRSYHNVLYAIRRVTEDNQGKKTAGVDKLVIKTPKLRLELSQELAKNKSCKPLPARRIFIPKSNGKLRPLGIPTIKDRCIQAIVKNTLEPCWEAQFEGESYGFRPGRGTHDAIGKIYGICRPNKTKKWVVDADIKGCFDNINHNKLLKTIGNFPYRKYIARWLKAGYIDKNTFYPTKSGTPQGGIISPLLANIALHGICEAIGMKYNNRGELRGKRAYVRYADDFAIFCETEKDAHKAKEEINKWLNSKGLNLSEEKTRIIHLTEGFDFLSFNIRHYKVSNTKTGYKLLIKPSKKFLQKTRNDIREIFLNHHGKPVNTLIGKINPVIRGKANYMKIGVSSESFRKLDDYLFKRQVRYLNRMHPTKSSGWKKKKYWGRLNLQRPNLKWVFGDKKTGNFMLRFAWTKIERHVTVSKRNSPDDPSLKEYWEKRQLRKSKNESNKLRSLHKRVAQRQNYKCPVCGQSIFNGETRHLHHITPRCKGGKDILSNLVWVHLICHHKIHHQNK